MHSLSFDHHQNLRRLLLLPPCCRRENGLRKVKRFAQSWSSTPVLSEQPDAQAGQHRDHHFTDKITGAEKGTRNSPRSETRTFSLPVRPVCSFLSHQLTTSSVPSCREAPLTPVGLGEGSSSTGPNTPEKPLQYSRAKTLRGFQARLLTKHLLEFRHKGTFNRTGLPGQSSSSVKAPNNLACNYILSCIVSDCVVNFVSSAQLEAGGPGAGRAH